MFPALRYRWIQGVAIALLAALVTACAVFAPLYDRALQQSMVRTKLAQAPADVSGIRIISVTPTTTKPPLTNRKLVSYVPPAVRRYLRPPVGSSTVEVGTWPYTGSSPTGSLVARSGACQHVRFASGRCPSARNEIAISTADVTTFGWKVGQPIPVAELAGQISPAKTPHKSLRVVGVYTPIPGRYWFNDLPTGRAGLTDSATHHTEHDWWLTDPATMAGPLAKPGSTEPSASWISKVNEADLFIDRSTVGIDQLLAMKKPVQEYLSAPVPVIGNGTGQPTAQASSGIADLATAAAHGRDQANTIVPLFMIQLALLAALTLWLVLGAAIDQRRPEVALARLRGRSTRGARSLLLADLGPVVAVGFLAGVGAAFGLSFAARHTWLTGGAPFEVLPPVLYAGLAAAAALAVMLLAVVHATALAPPAQLLRRVVPRRVGWAIGVGDLLLIVVAGAAFVAFATGSLSGSLAMAAPTLLALAVGLLLAHLLGPATAGIGRRLLSRGRVSPGLALLQVARRPGTRKVIATITVSTALLVFASDALVVGARNRADRAQAETGAAMVSTIAGTDVAAVQHVLHQVDPSGTHVTPVAQLSPPGEQGTTTEAVVPSQFANIAQFPGLAPDQLPWARLAPPPVPAISVTGTTFSARVRSAPLAATGQGPLKGSRLAPVQLRLLLTNSDAQQAVIGLGDLPVTGSGVHTVTAPIPCAHTCLITGLGIYAPGVHPPLSGGLTLSHASVSGHPVPLGDPGHWRNLTASGDGSMTPSNAREGLQVKFTDTGTSEVDLGHKSVPARVPALVAGPLPAGSQGDTFQAAGLDGITRPMTKVGSLRYAPGSAPATALVNLDVLERYGAPPASTMVLQVWFAHNDPALLAKVTAALKQQGIGISGTTTTADAQRVYDQTAATWGLQLGTVVGGAAAVIAALVLLIAVATSWRMRSRDYAALRMSGLPRRALMVVSVGEQLPLVLASIILGVACGVLGAHYAMPMVPLFATPPAIPILNLSTAWTAVAWALLGALVVLGVVGWTSGRWVARRARLTRLREAP